MVPSIAVSGCNPSSARQDAVESTASEGGLDTGVQFALTPEARRVLERRAEQGDGAAAHRIAQHYGMAGGDSGFAGDPKNSVEEDRWLKRASELGYESAKLSWAVKTGRRDCPGARRMLADLVRNGSNAGIRDAAQAWIDDDYLCR